MASKRQRKSDADRLLKVYERTKDGKPMTFAVLPKEPTDDDLQRFCDFLNSEGEFAEETTDADEVIDDDR
jgi:hypothetical protein